MKILFTFFLSCLLFHSLLAQDALTIGNRILGGGISFSQHETEDLFSPRSNIYGDRTSDQFSYSFSPYYGRFYEDLKMVGIRLSVRGINLERYNMDNTNDSEYLTEFSEKSFALGGFLRSYFPYSERFGVFIEPGIDLIRSTRLSRSSQNDINTVDESVVLVDQREYEEKTTIARVDTKVGLYLFLLDRLSIETRLAGINLVYVDRKLLERDLILGVEDEGDGYSTSINFNFINQLSFDQVFTINYYF